MPGERSDVGRKAVGAQVRGSWSSRRPVGRQQRGDCECHGMCLGQELVWCGRREAGEVGHSGGLRTCQCCENLRRARRVDWIEIGVVPVPGISGEWASEVVTGHQGAAMCVNPVGLVPSAECRLG